LLDIDENFSITACSKQSETVHILPIFLQVCIRCHSSSLEWSTVAKTGRICWGKLEWNVISQMYGIVQIT